MENAGRKGRLGSGRGAAKDRPRTPAPERKPAGWRNLAGGWLFGRRCRLGGGRLGQHPQEQLGVPLQPGVPILVEHFRQHRLDPRAGILTSGLNQIAHKVLKLPRENADGRFRFLRRQLAQSVESGERRADPGARLESNN